MITPTSDFEKAFYSDGFKLGMKAVEADFNDEVVANTLYEMYDAIDMVVDSLLGYAKTQEQTVSCKIGCAWCCHQPVFALDYELHILKVYVDKHFDDKTLEGIKTRAKKKQQKLKELSNKQLLNSKPPCPLLSEGICLAYKVRPMACRIYLSSDVNTCTKFFKMPNDESSYPALLDFPMRVGRMMNEGFKAALKTNGIFAKEFRIEEKLVDHSPNDSNS